MCRRLSSSFFESFKPLAATHCGSSQAQPKPSISTMLEFISLIMEEWT